MRVFSDEHGASWVATAREEQTPRHHTRWYLVFHPAGDEQRAVDLRDVRWQTLPTAARTLRTMSGFELRKRLRTALGRAGAQRAAGTAGA